MSQSYRLTEDGLQIRNSRNFVTEEYVRFESINPLAQALRDYIVTGPGLIPDSRLFLLHPAGSGFSP